MRITKRVVAVAALLGLCVADGVGGDARAQSNLVVAATAADRNTAIDRKATSRSNLANAAVSDPVPPRPLTPGERERLRHVDAWDIHAHSSFDVFGTASGWTVY